MKTQILFPFFIIHFFLSFSLTIIFLHNMSTIEEPIMMTTADDKSVTSFDFFSAINTLPPGKFFMRFSLSADFFQNKLFPKILSGIPSDWTQIRPDVSSGLIWVQSVCKSFQQMTLGGKE